MASQTPSFLKHEKFKIIQNFDLTYSIIQIDNTEWRVLFGPYMTAEEAFPDLRNLICEQE